MIFFEFGKCLKKNFVMGLKSISSFSRSDKFKKISSINFFSRDFFYKLARKKSCSNRAENWHIYSSDRMTKSVFTHKRENFLMGLKMDFEFFEVGQIYKRFPAKNFLAGISFTNWAERIYKRFLL